MKSMFTMAPFGQTGFAPAFTDPRPPVSLGQAQDDIAGLNTGIESILKELPPQVLGTYQARYADCQRKISTGGAVGLVTGGKCLYDLFQDLKDVVKGTGPKQPLPTPYLPPQAGGFPVVPLALAGVGGIILIYALSNL